MVYFLVAFLKTQINQTKIPNNPARVARGCNWGGGQLSSCSGNNCHWPPCINRHLNLNSLPKSIRAVLPAGAGPKDFPVIALGSLSVLVLFCLSVYVLKYIFKTHFYFILIKVSTLFSPCPLFLSNVQSGSLPV
jgi:hypothetical protein